MFEDAVDALRLGERARGKEILTRLLKADQNNPNYWIWMSAAVDTAKERIYCLETALKLDPQNAIAKRGLVLLGGRAPDENVQPFPLNRPRAWEDDLLLAHERPEAQGGRAAMGRPAARLAAVALVGLLVMALAAYGFFNLRTAALFRPVTIRTLGPTATFTLTPTFVNATEVIIPTQSGPTPLAQLLGLFYTPTPLYVNTPRSPLSADYYRGAKAALEQGNFDEYIRQMEQIQQAEPTAADVPYYIAEAYRLNGDCRSALNYYSQSLQVDDQFAPGYLGLARSRLCIDPGADTTQLYDAAIQADPNYGDAYLDRAEVVRVREDLGTEVIPFSIRDAWAGKPEANIELKPLDRVVVRSQMRPVEEVVVTGMVKRPGQYAITRGERLSNLILRAGGLEPGAFPKGAVFTRRAIRIAEQEQLEKFVRSQEQSLLAETSAVTAGASQLTSDNKSEVVSAQAAVLTQRRELLRTLASAVTLGRMAIRLDDAVVKERAWDIELEDGDTLYIPLQPRSVLVLGAVRNSTALLYTGAAERPDFYIAQAGGPTREADLDQMYILKPDGSTIASFPKVYNVEAGDTIIVPLSTEPKYRTLPVLRDIATILTGFALPFATIVALLK